MCTQGSSPQTSRTNLLSTPSLSVMSLQTGSVTSWHFPLAYSQSTINGRTGSNACTFIALVLSKLHFAAPELPRPHHPLSLTWVFRMVQGMEIGNKFYDSHSAGDPVMFGVWEAVQKVQASLGIASVRSELPADITRPPVATANLPHHIQLASLVNQTTSVFIIDQKTIYSNGPARFTTRQSLSCSKWCICCSTIFSFSTIFSELVQNTLNWYNCNCTGLFLSTV